MGRILWVVFMALAVTCCTMEIGRRTPGDGGSGPVAQQVGEVAAVERLQLTPYMSCHGVELSGTRCVVCQNSADTSPSVSCAWDRVVHFTKEAE